MFDNSKRLRLVEDNHGFPKCFEQLSEPQFRFVSKSTFKNLVNGSGREDIADLLNFLSYYPQR